MPALRPLTAALLLAALVVPALCPPAGARTAGRELPPEPYRSALEPTGDHVPAGGPGLGQAARAGTTYYGGTVWAADSSRWEAIRDSVWTFDTGVGSHFDYGAAGVNPYKYGAPLNPAPPGAGLHALMEGWVGIDNSYSGHPYFRRLGYADFAAEGADTCVGAFAGLDGQYSLWAGVFPSEADAMCYADGQGYGNSWNICVGRPFDYVPAAAPLLADVTWRYDYVNDTEPGWDYSYAIVDTSAAGDDVVVGVYTAPAGPATATHVLSPGTSMRSDAGPYLLKWCAVSDGAYSDEDGLYVTTCGMFAVDDVSVSGGGVSHAADFEADDGGWVLQPAAPGRGGDWSSLVDAASLPPVLTSCGCELADSVLVFEDLTVGGHGRYQDNIAASPWIDLLADGLDGSPGKFVEVDGYFDLPLTNYIFVQTQVQWYPAVCSRTGLIFTHPFVSDGFVRHFGGVPTCRQASRGNPVRIDFSADVDPGAEQMRIALGVISYCRYYPNCTGITNSTPWFDRARLGVYGNPAAPFISTVDIELPQDSWAMNGTLRPSAPGRVDCNKVKGDSEPAPGTSLGDTLVVRGGLGGAEVWVEFFVRPGPGVDSLEFTTWYESHPDGGARIGPWGPEQWKVARLDTAEAGGVVQPALWMTAYHEQDPSGNFTGSDTDIDLDDWGPNGPCGRLANDIFPDDLLGPGSRLNLFYKARYEGGGDWFTAPDTTGGGFYEMEVLPSSMTIAEPWDAPGAINCVLYVDHADGYGAQPVIEGALDSLLAQQSGNYERTWWDRFDVRGPSSGQGSLGRPLNTDYGASVLQILSYRVILWNSGSLSAHNLSQEDAEIITPFLTFDHGIWCFYGSGDDLVRSIKDANVTDPRAYRLMRDFCGVDAVCDRVGDAGCEPGSPAKPDSCIGLEPVAGSYLEAYASERTLSHLGTGNGCPQLRSFDVLTPYPGQLGSPMADEDYVAASVPWTTSCASVANRGTVYSTETRTVVDGISLHHRRDPSSCGDPAGNRVEPAVYERLREVFTWFGYADSTAGCEEPSWGAVDDPPGGDPPFRTGLANFSPNPLVGGAWGTIRFTLAREARATVEIFDVGGRLVRTVFDGFAPEGATAVGWNGLDAAGRPVAGGVYFYRLQALGDEYSRKMVVVRD